MLKQNLFKKIYLFLVSLIIVLIPSNLFIKINPSSAYVNGLLVDYLIPKLYISDIPILILLSLWLIEVVTSKKKLITKTSKLLFPSVLISLIIIRQIFTPYPLAAAWYLIKLTEIGFLGWFLATHKKIFQEKIIYYLTIATVWFQSILSVWQFSAQKSFLKYSFLGESNLSNSIGLAKDTWWQTGRVLPYGTTAHPNILGGVLTIFSLFLISNLLKTKSKWMQLLTAITVLLAIFIVTLTQSISAILTLIIGLIFIARKKINLNLLTTSGIILLIITPILINLASNKFDQIDSLTRRSYLQDAAVRMFLDNPIVGMGLNQFTTKVEKYSDAREVVRFIQPTHHIGLLWLAETGLLGVLLILVVGKKIKTKKVILPLLVLLPIATLDHYLLTQQSGLLLLIFSIATERKWRLE